MICCGSWPSWRIRLPTGVCVAEVFAGKDFVDHHDGLRSFIILIGEEAALLERNAHGRQIAGLDPVDHRHAHFALTRRFWLAFDPEEQVVLALPEELRPPKMKLPGRPAIELS